jgi:hypothetical protein
MMAQLTGVTQGARAGELLSASVSSEEGPAEHFAAVMGRASEMSLGDETGLSSSPQTSLEKASPDVQSRSPATPAPIGVASSTLSGDQVAPAKKVLLSSELVEPTVLRNQVSTPSPGNTLQMTKVSSDFLQPGDSSLTNVPTRPALNKKGSGAATTPQNVPPGPQNITDEEPLEAAKAGRLTGVAASIVSASLPQAAIVPAAAAASGTKAAGDAGARAKHETPRTAKSGGNAFENLAVVSTGVAITVGLTTMQVSPVATQESAIEKNTKGAELSILTAKPPVNALGGGKSLVTQGLNKPSSTAPSAVPSPNTAATAELAKLPASGVHDIGAVISETTGPVVVGGVMSVETSLMPVPHTLVVSSLTSLAQSPAQTATAVQVAGSAPADAASTIESSGATLSPAMLRATPTSLEVGVATGAHGWLKIRADLTSEGVITASMSGISASVARELRSELPGLTSYLAEERVAVSVLSVDVATASISGAPTHALMGTGTGLDGDQGGGAGTSQREAETQQHSPKPIAAEDEVRGRDSVSPSAVRYGIETSLGDAGLGSPAGYGSGGGWLNVRV